MGRMDFAFTNDAVPSEEVADVGYAGAEHIQLEVVEEGLIFRKQSVLPS